MVSDPHLQTQTQSYDELANIKKLVKMANDLT